MSESSRLRPLLLSRRVLMSVLLIPLLALTSVLTVFVAFGHPNRAHAATLPSPWWHHLNGERELDAVRFGYTLADVQSNLSTYKAQGYQVINLDWPVQAGPTCIYGGFSASDYYHADSRLAAAGTNADTAWANFVTAVHSQGMAVDSWFNPSYIWTGAAIFKQAEADVKTYGPIRANQPANSPARYFEWRAQAGVATKQSDTYCDSTQVDRWVTDPDVGSNISYYSAFSDQPSGDYSSAEWVTYIEGSLKHWMDTGIDGFVFDWPPDYVNCNSTCIKNTLVATVHSYSNKAAFGEGYNGATDSLSNYGFDGVENISFWGNRPWTDAINSQNPASIETSSTMTDRDSDTLAGVTSYEQFAPGVLNDNAKNLLSAATLMGTGHYLMIQSTQATSENDGSNFGEFGTWPSDSTTQARFAALTNAMRTNAALDNSGSRIKLPTNNDNAYYAFLRVSPDNSARAIAVLNFTGSQQTITVNISNQDIANGATTNLVGSGGNPTISNGSFSVTLPAWGYGFYGVSSTTCGSNLCGAKSTPLAQTNLTNEGTSDWAHWGENNYAYKFINKNTGNNQISTFSQIGTGTVNWYTNNPTSFSWLDGNPTGIDPNNTAGVWVSGVNNGLSITVPADTTQRTLRVYVGVWKAQGKLTATLSDASATSYTDTTLTNSSGTTTGEYTLKYKANSANQHLTVSFTVQTSYDPNGNISLQDATLQRGGATGGSSTPTPVPATATPMPPTATPAGGTTVTVDDNASGWTYSGWYAYSDSNTYQGTAHGNSANGNYGSYTFTGTGVDVYTWKGPDGGSVQVCVDTTCSGTLSLNNASDIYNQKIYSVSGLSNGSHTVKITANSSDGNLWEMVDDIVYTK